MAFEARLIGDEDIGAGIRRLQLQIQGVAPHFEAGQYIGLHAPDGAQVFFSIASLPVDLPMLELHYAATPGSDDVQRMQAILDAASIRFDAPAGSAGLFAAPDATNVLLIAAATGIAHAMAIARGWLSAPAQVRALSLYWGVREARQLYAAPQLVAWAAQDQRFRWCPVVSDDVGCTQRCGLVIDAVLEDEAWRAADLIILSGSPAMVHASADRLRAVGVSAARMRSDMF